MKRYLRILSLIMVILIAFSAFSISASAKTIDEYYQEIFSDVDTTYKSEIEPHFYPELFEGRENLWFYYNMLYAHNLDVAEEPEYVVFIALTGIGEDAIISQNFGYCVVYNHLMDYPYDLGHYVYVPEKQKVYTLEEAYNSEEIDISDAMRSGCVGLHRGDINYDRSCDVLDATYIQRYLAGLDIDSDINIRRMDLDGSGDVSIIDATRLQRYIAKMDDSFTDVAVTEP